MPHKKTFEKKHSNTYLQMKNSWVFLVKGETIRLEKDNDTTTPDIVTMKHPKRDDPALFLFSPFNNSVQEIFTFNEGKRSWFIDESVKSNGKLHLSTPIDPLFLILPYLRKHCTSQASSLDNFLRDEEFPETVRLLKCSGLDDLNMISNRKGDEDPYVFEYNEEKTLHWLKRKTEKIAGILKRNESSHITNGDAKTTLMVSLKEDFQENDVYVRHAHGIISDYLVDDLSKKLLTFLNLSDNQNLQTLKRKAYETPALKSKRIKSE